jgi:hypothetical protein
MNYTLCWRQQEEETLRADPNNLPTFKRESWISKIKLRFVNRNGIFLTQTLNFEYLTIKIKCYKSVLATYFPQIPEIDVYVPNDLNFYVSFFVIDRTSANNAI